VRVRVSEGEGEGEVKRVLSSSKVTSARSCSSFLVLIFPKKSRNVLYSLMHNRLTNRGIIIFIFLFVPYIRHSLL
jgi:hypothetical protein